MKIKKKDEWWKNIFDERYLKTFGDILTPEVTGRQVSFLVKYLDLNKKDKVLDLACGFGRHSLEIARRGISVVGVDYSEYMLRLARKQALLEKLKNIVFVQGDMRRIAFRSRFDAVISMFTSFGYFEREEDHVRVLLGIRRALKPSGKFFLDINNASRIINWIKKSGTRDHRNNLLTSIRQDKLSNNVKVTTQEWYDSRNGRWIMRRSWNDKGRKHSFTSNVRIFTAPEISALLRSVGLRVVRLWGDYEGRPHSKVSRRLLVYAIKKPGNNPGTNEEISSERGSRPLRRIRPSR